jgi:sphinganine-1-phosphate aldolase
MAREPVRLPMYDSFFADPLVATSGGTESILMACKAYRDWARATKGITRPEMYVHRPRRRDIS